MDFYFYSARPLCIFYFVPNYSLCYILVFSFRLLLLINVYIIYIFIIEVFILIHTNLYAN